MGTAASSTDEWIELENKTDQDIDLRGWTLRAQDGTPSIALSRVLPRHGFYLLERTDDSTVGDITADQIYTGSLSDGGESLVLMDAAGETIDTANGSGGPWPAGNGNSHSTMERVNPSTSDQDANWRTNDGVRRNGRDAKGAPLNGTPKAGNSCTNPPVALFTFRIDPAARWYTVVFVDQSTDRDGRVVTWTWDFGDGSTSHDQSPAHQYRSVGAYGVTLLVRDSDGLTGSVQTEVRIVNTRGDVDSNGVVDVIDVRILLQATLGLLGSTAERNPAADVDGDGDVDADDARLLARRVIGL